jgi:hypothetical protein
MRAKVVLAVTAAALLAGGIAFGIGVASHQERPPMFYSGGETHGPRPAPNCRELDPPCPEVKPPIALNSSWEEDRLAILFEPPPEDAVPALDADEAVDVAWQEGGVEATSQQAILALVPEGDDFRVDVLVWIIRYEGYCFTSIGNPRSGPHERRCSYQPYYTMIDAETGEFIMSWTAPPQ